MGSNLDIRQMQIWTGLTEKEAMCLHRRGATAALSQTVTITMRFLPAVKPTGLVELNVLLSSFLIKI